MSLLDKVTRRLLLQTALTAALFWSELRNLKSSGHLRGERAKLSQRNIVNVGFTFQFDYPLILANSFNRCFPLLNGVGPFDGFSLDPYPKMIDRDGYPNTVDAASASNVVGSFNIPSPLNFTGPWIITWDGDGAIGVTGTELTWTELNDFEGGLCAISIADPATIAFANLFVAGQRLHFTTTGSLPDGLVEYQAYYVLAVGLSRSSFRISLTPDGAPVVTSGRQHGVHTVSGNYRRAGNGFYRNVTGQKAYVIAGYSGTGLNPQQILYSIRSTASPEPIRSIDWVDGVVTVAMVRPHKRPIGSRLKLTLIGSNNAEVNGTFLSTIASSIKFTFSLAGSGKITTPGAMCAFVSNIQIYRQVDEADLLAGKVFRSAWKQPIVDLNPSAIRFMNWNGGNTGQAYSFANRNTPNLVNWGPPGAQAPNFTAGPAYGRTTGMMAYKVEGVYSGTVSNPSTTPLSMIHGEVCQAQIGVGGTVGRGSPVAISAVMLGAAGRTVIQTSSPSNVFVGDRLYFTVTGAAQLNSLNGSFAIVTSIVDRTHFKVNVDTSSSSPFTSGSFTGYTGVIALAAITKAANAQVTTAINHGLSIGEIIIHTIASGMTHLDRFPVTVSSVIDARNYTINLNTTSFPSFVAEGAALQSFATLDVGSRGAYPVIFPDGTPATNFGNAYLSQGNYKTFIFDKNASGQSDGTGKYINGAWIFNGFGSNGFSNDVPLEICVAAVNELNAMSPARPIHMYASSPFGAMTSIDPDSSAENIWGTNMVGVIMNGANGYAGLADKASLLTEFSNEIWNSSAGVSNFLNWRGFVRWPSFPISRSYFYDAGMLWGTAFQRDVGSSNPRVYRVQGGAVNEGSAIGSGLYYRAFGSRTVGLVGNLYLTDAIVTAQGWGAPILNVDMLNFAAYLSPATSYWSGGGFASDASLYSAGGEGRTTAINNFITQMVSSAASSGAGLTVADYLTFVDNVNRWLPSGKFLVNYEGGPDWPTAAGAIYNGHPVTLADSNFLLAVQNSAELGTAIVNFFDSLARYSKCELPSVYTMVSGSRVEVPDQRWSYVEPDTYPLPPGSGGEGRGFLYNGTWVAMTKRNALLD